jgi:hypothetical protein
VVAFDGLCKQIPAANERRHDGSAPLEPQSARRGQSVRRYLTLKLHVFKDDKRFPVWLGPPYDPEAARGAVCRLSRCRSSGVNDFILPSLVQKDMIASGEDVIQRKAVKP